MLSLLLALLVTASDAGAANVLRACDTDGLTKECGLYLHGFLDAMAAQTYIAAQVEPLARRDGVHLPAFACFPAEFDMDAVRVAIVAALKKDRHDKQPARVEILMAVSRAYPCGK